MNNSTLFLKKHHIGPEVPNFWPPCINLGEKIFGVDAIYCSPYYFAKNALIGVSIGLADDSLTIILCSMLFGIVVVPLSLLGWAVSATWNLTKVPRWLLWKLKHRRDSKYYNNFINKYACF